MESKIYHKNYNFNYLQYDCDQIFNSIFSLDQCLHFTWIFKVIFDMSAFKYWYTGPEMQLLNTE